MHANNRRAYLLLLIAVVVILALVGCSKNTNILHDAPAKVVPQVAGCEGCHTDADMLQATADPVDTPPPSSGEG